MSWWSEFHFLRPYWLIALIVPFVWSWIIVRNETIQSSWAEVCDEHLLKYLLIKGENKQRRIPYILGVVFLILTILSLAGPTWHKKQNPALSVDNPVMILLNLSDDMMQTDVTPNRFSRAKYIIQDVLQTFNTTETGLMVYVDEPFVLTPLTEDVSLIENLLPEIDQNIVPSGGDRLDRAIDMAVGRMQNAGYDKGNLIVITADVTSYFETALQNAEKAYRQGFEVNIIKVGTQENDKLKMIAEKGGGLYLNYNQSYETLSQKINDIYKKELKESENMQSEWVDGGYYLLWLPALLFLYYFRKGIVFAFILCCLSSPVYAGWFLNNNQEGMRYFKQEQYDAAAQKFEDARWRGAAAYKNGDYEKAYQDFAAEDDATALYNQGNALAKSGKIDKAIEKYEKALDKQPDFEDAAYNLEYLKQLQQQQQSSENQKNDNSDKREDNTQQEDGPKKQDTNQNAEGDGEQGDNEQQQNEENPENNSQNQNKQRGQQDETEEDRAQQGNQQDKNDNEDKADSENQKDGEEQDSQNSQQKQEQNQQSDEQNQQEQSERNVNSEQNKNSEQQSDNNSQQPQNQSAAEENGTEDETQTEETQAQSGNEDEQSDTEAENEAVEFGDTEDKDREMRLRMQKFRNVPEDTGGLLRALIAKEYSKNRYKDE